MINGKKFNKFLKIVITEKNNNLIEERILLNDLTEQTIYLDTFSVGNKGKKWKMNDNCENE